MRYAVDFAADGKRKLYYIKDSETYDDQLMEASREFYEKHSDLYGIKELL